MKVIQRQESLIEMLEIEKDILERDIEYYQERASHSVIEMVTDRFQYHMEEVLSTSLLNPKEIEQLRKISSSLIAQAQTEEY